MTAASMSSGPASATVARRSPVAGLMVSKVRPDAASFHSPPIRSRLGCASRKALTAGGGGAPAPAPPLYGGEGEGGAPWGFLTPRRGPPFPRVARTPPCAPPPPAR